jgi:hypothetical protein
MTEISDKQLKIKVYWDVMLCHWTSSSWCWYGSLHLQNFRNYLSNVTARHLRRLFCSNSIITTSNLAHTGSFHGHASVQSSCVWYVEANKIAWIGKRTFFHKTACSFKTRVSKTGFLNDAQSTMFKSLYDFLNFFSCCKVAGNQILSPHLDQIN